MKTGVIFMLEEKFMKFKQQNTKKTRQITEEFLKFWNVYDKIYFTNHGNMIEKLYYNKAANLTVAAQDGFVCDKTLYTYRSQYMKVFSVICEEHKITL